MSREPVLESAPVSTLHAVVAAPQERAQFAEPSARAYLNGSAFRDYPVLTEECR